MDKITDGLISWASLLEEKTREQAVTTASLPWIWPHVALMPDAHWGMGSTVGSVIPTTDVVMPAAVGVDIGCGMSAARTTLTKADLADLPPLSGLRHLIEEAVPVSMGGYRKRLSQTAQARAENLEAAAETAGFNPASYAGNWHLQLGTLGSGNHFIEVCLDEEDRVWVFLHSGSRGIGNKIARHHVKIAQQMCERWYVQLPHKDLAFIPSSDPAFWTYIAELRWAQRFAAENRAEMVDQVIGALEVWAGHPDEHGSLRSDETVTCHHNYTEQEKHFGREVWLTRKGAINAAAGKLGLIPGSMGTCSYVVRGLGNSVAFNSAPHGAGRNFSRTEARKRFTAADLETAMVGVEWRSEIASALIDEIPAAYKPVDVVMNDAKDLVEVVHTLKQVLNVKGT